MTTAVWRPTEREAYPVLGVESYDGRGADIVVELATGDAHFMQSAPLEQIQVLPMRPGASWLPRATRYARSVVRARTARLIDCPLGGAS